MDVLTPYETEHLVKSIEEICVREYSGKQWLSQHEVIYKLNLQSHRNAKAREDEYVQDSMVVHDKIKAIIYNLVVSETWKAKVMPLCYSEIVELPSITSYSLIYHEAVICNFLSVLFYHRASCVEAGDYLVDLVDWAYRKLVKLNVERADPPENPSKIQEFVQQNAELEFAMGIECLSIVRFITDHLADLTLSVTQQLVEQCDIFCVIVPLMEAKPWRKTTKAGKMIFEDQKWKKCKDTVAVPKAEAQIWLIVFNLFMNSDVRMKYELTSYRKQNLLRLRKFINETVIDQIPVLNDLLRSLEELSLVGDMISNKISAFAVQLLPELQDKISYGQNWEEIANYQKQKYLINNPEEHKKAVELMMSGIDDMLDEPICAQCGEMATNRCSKCHYEWYCSRKCQVSAWKTHKKVCDLLCTQAPSSKPEEKSISQKIIDITND